MIGSPAFALTGTFGFFSACCGVMTLLVLFFLPETKGARLERMEDIFRSFAALPWMRRIKLEKKGVKSLSRRLASDIKRFGNLSSKSFHINDLEVELGAAEAKYSH